MTVNSAHINSLTVDALMSNIESDHGAFASPSSTISNISLQHSPNRQHQTKILQNTDIVDHTIKAFINNPANFTQSMTDDTMSAEAETTNAMSDADGAQSTMDDSDVPVHHEEADAMTDYDHDLPSASHSPKSHLSHTTNLSEIDPFTLTTDGDSHHVDNDEHDDEENEHKSTENCMSSTSSSSSSKRQLTVAIPGPSPSMHADANDQLDSEPLSESTPAADHIPSHLVGEPQSVWLTPAQARSETKKLKGYRWVPVEPQNSAVSVLATRMVHEKRERKERKIDDDFSSSIQSPLIGPSPTVKREKSSASTASGARKSTASESSGNLTPAVRKSSSQFQEPVPRSHAKKVVPIDNAHIRALELRLEALKRQQKLLRAQSGGDSHDDETTEDDEEFVRNKKRKSSAVDRKSTAGEKRHKSEDAAQSPVMSSHPLSSPSMTAVSTIPSVSKRGRNIRTPSQFTTTEPVTLIAELKRCKTLLDHLMAYKPADSVFNQPVNYINPGEPYFAAGYLEVIGGPAMDLGTIKSRLNEGVYSNMQDFAADVRIVWRNAQRYNQETDWIHTTAKEMSNLFEGELLKISEAMQRDEERKLKRQAERAAQAASGIIVPTTPAASDDYLMSEFEFDSNPPLHAASPSSYSANPARRPAINRQSSAGSSPSLSRASSSSPNNVSKITPLTQREKHILKDDIFRLPPHRLGSVLEIIGKDPHHAHVIPADDDEVEIDIDNLQVQTLRHLQEFVKQTLAAKRKSSSASAASPIESNTPRASPSNANLTSPHRIPESPDLNMPASPHARKVDPRSKYDTDSSDDDSEGPKQEV